MQIIQADAMGICFGVRDALQTMRAIQTPAQVTVFGQLVHNPAVMREMARRGFRQVEEAERRPADSVTTPQVLITAHGVSDHERTLLAGTGAQTRQIIDTTGPLVRKAHRAALALAQAGFFVLVIGKKGHVEVRGLTGDLPPGRFDVVETQMGVRFYNEPRIGIMAQTTAVEQDARAIVAQVRALNPAAEVRFVNTICQPTRDRQAALERLLEQVTVLVVVGGRDSNNTKQLVTRARETGIRTLHIESPADLRPDMFAPDDRVGLTAGTSTLPETIDAIKIQLQQIHPEPRPHSGVLPIAVHPPMPRWRTGKEAEHESQRH
jgi:4-hydroxy-3-methylbut-2-enyl diphosphate reductase